MTDKIIKNNPNGTNDVEFVGNSTGNSLYSNLPVDKQANNPGTINFFGSSFSGTDIKLFANLYSDNKGSRNKQTILAEEIDFNQQVIDGYNLVLGKLGQISIGGPINGGNNSIIVGLRAAVQSLTNERAKTTVVNSLDPSQIRVASSLTRLTIQKKISSYKQILLTKQNEINDVNALDYEAYDIIELGTLQTISIQSHREKYAVRALGHSHAKNFTRGQRCIPASEKVFIKNKGYISIADVKQNDLVQSSPNTFNRVVNSWYQGKKECYKIKLENGYSLQASFDHPIFANNQWIKMEDLQINDNVFVSTFAPSEEKDLEIDDDIIQIIAYLIGNGSIHTYDKPNNSKEYRINLSIADNKIDSIGANTELILNKLNIPFKDYRKNNDKCINRKISVCLKDYAETDYRQRKYNKLHQYLLKYNLYNTYSHTKFIPQEFLSYLSNRQIKLFLSHLFTTNGCYFISKNLKHIEARYNSTSEQLIDQIRFLLFKLNIPCIKNYKQKKTIKSKKLGIIAKHNSYGLTISHSLDFVKFYQKVGIFGKDKKVEPYIDLILSRIKDCYFDIDIQTFSKKINKFIDAKRFNKTIIKTKYNLYNKKLKINPRKALALGKELQNTEYDNYINNLINQLINKVNLFNTFKIKNIEKIGILPVYDLEVEERHAFICNFIKVHNTIAGSMIFTVFHEHALKRLIYAMGQSSTFGELDPEISSLIPDQLPPIDFTLVFANEYGQISEQRLYGVEFLNDAVTYSIEDIFTEQVMNFVCRDVDILTARGKVRLSRLQNQSGLLEDFSGSKLLFNNKEYDKYLDRLNIRRRIRNR